MAQTILLETHPEKSFPLKQSDSQTQAQDQENLVAIRVNDSIVKRRLAKFLL